MATLAEVVDARAKLTSARESRASLQATAIDRRLRLEFAKHRDALLAPTFADPNRAAERALRRMQVERLPPELEAILGQIAELDQEIAARAERLEELVSEQPALWDSDVPVVLFPIRLETCFRPRTGGVDLLIRVYPDELQIDGLKRQLSAAEQEAGRTYWRSVWPSLGQAEEEVRTQLNASWKELVKSVTPERAAWVASRVRPTNVSADLANPGGPVDSEPRFPRVDEEDVGIGAQAVLLPDRWTAYGLKEDRLLFRVEGRPIQRPLPVSALRQPEYQRRAGAVSNEWLVDFDEAVNVGMALIVPLEESRPSIDQLLVSGVCADLSPEKSARAVADALSAHAYRGALEFVPPRASTNNTADAGSFWHSGRDGGGSPDARRLAFTPGSAQNAALLSRALGIDGQPVLAGVPSATEDWQTSPGVMMDALWPALTVDWDQMRRNELNLTDFGAYTQQASNYDLDTMDALRSDTVQWVRNRGPLPAVRVGRQPYGVLPVSSLDFWANANDTPTDAMKLGILRQLRPFWQAALVNVPRVHGRQDQDRALLEVLVQDAVSARMTFRKAVGHDNYDSPEPLTIVQQLPWQSSLLTRIMSEQPGLYDVPLVGDGEYLKSYWKKRRQIIDDCLRTPPANAQTIDDKAKAFLGTQVAHEPSITKTLLYALFNYGQVREEDSIIGMEGINGDVNEFYAGRARQQARLLDALATVNASELELLLLETVDLFSHRLDAWITSLATKRLSEMRTDAPAGCRIGGYGFVESLTAPEGLRPFDEIRERETDAYVLAPSLHHAASAAVLRSGFDSHSEEGAFAVSLTSTRARQARWIVDGVRNGQTIGALLGYWFERGLHDVGQDHFIERIRQQFPLPIVAGQQEAEAPGVSFETISARNVADGLALYRAITHPNEFPLTAPATALIAELNGIEPVQALLHGLRALVDAVGDLVLAESVHQLVGGNPLRAGLAADTLGRGESLPSRFDIIASPRSGVGLTCSVAALLPADVSTPENGWNRERPRAFLSPQAEAWIAGLLGPSSAWHFEAKVQRDEGPTVVPFTMADLEVSALDVLYEIQVTTGDTHSILERRALDHVRQTAPSDADVQLAAGASRDTWLLLAAHAQRIGAILRGARPLQLVDLAPVDRAPDPSIDRPALTARMSAAGSTHAAVLETLSGAASAFASAGTDERASAAEDVAVVSAIELAFRVNEYLKGIAGAAATLAEQNDRLAAAQSDAAKLAAARAVESALRTLADYGVDGSYPAVAADSTSAVRLVSEQASRILAVIEGFDLPEGSLPIPDTVRLRAWIDEVIAIVRRVAGGSFPIAAAFVPPSDGELALNLTDTTSLKGAGYPEVMSWLRRVARVRPALRDVHDIFLARETRHHAPETVRVIQTPHDAANDQWAAQDFLGRRPKGPQRTAVLHAPKPYDARTPLCGWLIDAWSERIPGLASLKEDPAASRSEMAGLTFHFNQPDAQAPHVVLVAVPPELGKPWTEDILLHILSETLDLAKMRAIDHRDLPRLTPLLPATYIIHADNNGDKWPLEMNPDIM